MYVLALKVALGQLRTQFLSRSFVILSVAAILFINAMVFLLFQGVSRSLAEVRSARFITAYLRTDVPAASEPGIVSAVRKVPGVSGASLVSKEVFVENFSKYFPQLAGELSTLEADTIPRYVKVQVDSGSSATVKEQLQKVSGVEQVELNQNRYAGLVGALSTLRKVAAALLAGMTIALLCVLLNHFKLKSSLQAQVMGTLTLLGARGRQLMLPFAIEGMLEGLAGGLLAVGAIFVLGHSIETQLGGMFRSIGYHPVHLHLAFVAAGVLATGMLSGIVGSVWAASRAKNG